MDTLLTACSVKWMVQPIALRWALVWFKPSGGVDTISARWRAPCFASINGARLLLGIRCCACCCCFGGWWWWWWCTHVLYCKVIRCLIGYFATNRLPLSPLVDADGGGLCVPQHWSHPEYAACSTIVGCAFQTTPYEDGHLVGESFTVRYTPRMTANSLCSPHPLPPHKEDFRGITQSLTHTQVHWFTQNRNQKTSLWEQQNATSSGGTVKSVKRWPQICQKQPPRKVELIYFESSICEINFVWLRFGYVGDGDDWWWWRLSQNRIHFNHHNKATKKNKTKKKSVSNHSFTHWAHTRGPRTSFDCSSLFINTPRVWRS